MMLILPFFCSSSSCCCCLVFLPPLVVKTLKYSEGQLREQVGLLNARNKVLNKQVVPGSLVAAILSGAEGHAKAAAKLLQSQHRRTAAEVS